MFWSQAAPHHCIIHVRNSHQVLWMMAYCHVTMIPQGVKIAFVPRREVFVTNCLRIGCTSESEI